MVNQKVLNVGLEHEAQAALEEDVSLDMELARRLHELAAIYRDSETNRVDYRRLSDAPAYRECVRLSGALNRFNPRTLNVRERRVAFWINIYNLMILHGIVELGITESVKEVPDFHQSVGYLIGGLFFSPNDVRHGILRANARPPYRFRRLLGGKDPRLPCVVEPVDPHLHFALASGCKSSPRLAIYEAGELLEQLKESTASFINSREVRVHPEQNTLELSQLFKWYRKDFGSSRAAVNRFIARYLREGPEREYLTAHIIDIKHVYRPFDWSLNT